MKTKDTVYTDPIAYGPISHKVKMWYQCIKDSKGRYEYN